MNATLDIRAILDATANQILAVVAPDTARLVRAYVSLDETADTAATDGVRIWLPPTFEGVDVAHDTPVAVGLLVHELGHFLQPLKALEEVEQQSGAPHWLGNIIADIELEAMMAGLFPPLADTLKAVRAVVKQAHLADYRRSLQAGRTFPAIACSVALTGRFGNPELPFDINPHGDSQTLFAALRTIASQTAADRALQFAWRLAGATEIAPAQTPAYVEETIQTFPELRQAAETFPTPGGALSVVGPAGRAAQAEAASNTGQHEPQSAEPVASVRTVRGRPRPEAQQAARGLRLHFQVARSATEIAAPGRLDRRAAVLGELIPLRMALPGKERPRPKVLICLDKSGSMKGAKFVLAQTAAQAVALAVREAGGEVVGVLFDDSAQIATSSDEALLFCDPAGLSYGGTGFEFLADAWRRWPAHAILLVTDGDGSIPPAMPGDKARTSAILIPPDCDAALMGQIAARVVTLNDLRGLADVMTLLTPRASC
ncbi:MAG: hypothetical protein FJ011_22945 [Chloroflexi bacterium]|nr:hypothetical protein [Chloroflexota bacterium]